jgi:hypothetical protein
MKNSIIRLAVKAVVVTLVVVQSLIFLPTHAGITNKAYAENKRIVATWLWNTYSIWKEKDITLDFLGRNGVNLLYLQIDEEIPAVVYSAFIREAASRGIEVHALGGDPNWVLPDQHVKLYHFIDWVNTYNNGVLPVERFNGIHLDVEPYVLPQWRIDPDKTMGLWMDLMSGFVQQVKADTHLTAGADLPVWLDKASIHDGNGGRITLSDWMIRKLDQVALMAYIDNAKDIIKSVSNEMDEAEKAGTPVIIGVDTFKNYDEHGSFYAKGSTQMQNELNTVVQALSSKSAFSGYAVHEYQSWSTLKQ